MQECKSMYIETLFLSLSYCLIKCLSIVLYVSYMSLFAIIYVYRRVHIPADDGSDPANLSLSERIKLFNIKMSEQRMMQKREAPRRRLSRFQTQPVTPDEVESAKCITPPHVALGVCFCFICSFVSHL